VAAWPRFRSPALAILGRPDKPGDDDPEGLNGVVVAAYSSIGPTIGIAITTAKPKVIRESPTVMAMVRLLSRANLGVPAPLRTARFRRTVLPE
jgi:hypothetical protein